MSDDYLTEEEQREIEDLFSEESKKVATEAVPQLDSYGEHPTSRDATKENLKKKAESTSEKIQDIKGKVKSKAVLLAHGVDIVMEILDKDSEVTNRGGPPPWSEVVTNEDYASIIDEVDSIIRNYITNDFEYDKAQGDILHIASFLIYLSTNLSKYQGQVAEARSRLENYKTKVYIKAKKAAQEEGSKLTDTDAKELAAYYAIPIAEELAILEQIDRYLSSSYYSIKMFLETLNFVTGREAKLKQAPGAN